MGGDILLPSRLVGLGENCPPLAESGVECQQKTTTILEHFVPKKLPLVIRIVLNVIKCCVIQLLM